MAKRLQVILKDPEYREIPARCALAPYEPCGMGPPGAGSRTPGRAGRQSHRKLEAIRMAVQHEYPAGDLDTMLAEVEAGYLSGPRS